MVVADRDGSRARAQKKGAPAGGETADEVDGAEPGETEQGQRHAGGGSVAPKLGHDEGQAERPEDGEEPERAPALALNGQQAVHRVAEEGRGRELKTGGDHDGHQHAPVRRGAVPDRQGDRGGLDDRSGEARCPPQAREQIRTVVGEHAEPVGIDPHAHAIEQRDSGHPEHRRQPGRGGHGGHRHQARSPSRAPDDEHQHRPDARHRHDGVDRQCGHEEQTGDERSLGEQRRDGRHDRRLREGPRHGARLGEVEDPGAVGRGHGGGDERDGDGQSPLAAERAGERERRPEEAGGRCRGDDHPGSFGAEGRHERIDEPEEDTEPGLAVVGEDDVAADARGIEIGDRAAEIERGIADDAEIGVADGVDGGDQHEDGDTCDGAGS